MDSWYKSTDLTHFFMDFAGPLVNDSYDTI